MRAIGFKIVGVGVGGDKERQGKTFILREIEGKEPKPWKTRIKTFDDDKNLVYTMDCSSESVAEYAHDFAMNDCGATYSEILTPNGWEDFIG